MCTGLIATAAHAELGAWASIEPLPTATSRAPDTEPRDTRFVDRGEYAAIFDGRTGFFETIAPAGEGLARRRGTSLTVELWVKPGQPPSAETAVIAQESVGLAARDPWSLRAHPGGWFQVRIDGPHRSERVDVELARDVWSHVAFVWTENGSGRTDGRRHLLQVFVNGKMADQTPTGVIVEPRPDPVRIGAAGVEFGQPLFIGLVDQVRVWAEPRTREQIARGMYLDPTEAPVGDMIASTENLMAAWTFDHAGDRPAAEPVGTPPAAPVASRVRDASGRGHELIWRPMAVGDPGPAPIPAADGHGPIHDWPPTPPEVIGGTPTATPAPRPGVVAITPRLPSADLTRDGTVTKADLALFIGAIDLREPSADINRDGAIDWLDRDLFLRAYGRASPDPANPWHRGCG